MLTKRLSEDRGPTDAGWLKSMHSFSFGQYQDPEHMGFGPLRVINEDYVAPSGGFDTHPHNNMEIISYVLSGSLAHKDSIGNGFSIKPGEIQIMSAGSGVTHSEFNDSDTEEAHFLQIWIMPNVENQEPGYQQKAFDPAEMQNALRLVASPDGVDGSLFIKQDAKMFAGKFNEGAETTFETESNRRYWIQMARGDAKINGEKISAGDGLAIEEENVISIQSTTDSEMLLFDLPL